MVAKDEKLACRTEIIFVDLWGTDATLSVNHLLVLQHVAVRVMWLQH